LSRVVWRGRPEVQASPNTSATKLCLSRFGVRLPSVHYPSIPLPPVPTFSRHLLKMDGWMESLVNKLIRQILCLSPKSVHMAGNATSRMPEHRQPNLGTAQETSTTFYQCMDTYSIKLNCRGSWSQVRIRRRPDSAYSSFVTTGEDYFYSFQGTIEYSDWPTIWTSRWCTAPQDGTP
jgi:hypothetical protein